MSKYYCFTLNNYTDDEVAHLNEIDCTFLVYGFEIGEIENTPHLQGYIEFPKKHKLTAVKSLLGNRYHLEFRKGTQEQAVLYCEKDGNVVRRGIPTVTKRGKRSDIDNARTAANVGGMKLVTKTTQSVQAMRVAERYLEYNEKPRDYKPHVTWIWGPSGSGKSMLARQLCENAYTKSEGTKWWPGYDGHENVIIDDFRENWWSFTEMLSLLDRYEKRIEYKGGNRQFLGRNIVVTSIRSPENVYMVADEPVVQLLRRIDVITKLELAGPEVVGPEVER
nr:MAG TPA: Rep protein [Cressdnaviricota sp.]